MVLDEFEGNRYLALRVWQRDRAGTWWPVKGKGLSVRLSEAEGVAAALQQALDLAEQPAHAVDNVNRKQPPRRPGG